jgi:hypothetical protein
MQFPTKCGRSYMCSSSVIWPCICRKTDLSSYVVHRYDSQKLAPYTIVKWISEMDSRDSLYEPVEAFHVVISCDYQHNLCINVSPIVILVTYKYIQKSFCTFAKIFLFMFWMLQMYYSSA